MHRKKPHKAAATESPKNQRRKRWKPDVFLGAVRERVVATIGEGWSVEKYPCGKRAKRVHYKFRVSQESRNDGNRVQQSLNIRITRKQAEDEENAG